MVLLTYKYHLQYMYMKKTYLQYFKFLYLLTYILTMCDNYLLIINYFSLINYHLIHVGISSS